MASLILFGIRFGIFDLFDVDQVPIPQTSVSDPDPCGTVLIWHPGSGSILRWISWIRIHIGNTDPDLGDLNLAPKNEKNLNFVLKYL